MKYSMFNSVEKMASLLQEIFDTTVLVSPKESDILHDANGAFHLLIAALRSNSQVPSIIKSQGEDRVPFIVVVPQEEGYQVCVVRIYLRPYKTCFVGRIADMHGFRSNRLFCRRNP